jgi:hypothetical protein
MDKNGAAAIVAGRVDAGCLTYPADPTLGKAG